MRVTKFPAVLGLTMLGALALTIVMTVGSAGPERNRAGVAWAQLPPSNSLVVPQAAPSPPAQLTAPASEVGLPPLVSVPLPPQAAASPSARTFNCSCFGTASQTHWMGQVTAPGYFAARQAATGACIASNREPQSPLMQPQPAQPAVTLPQGFESMNAAGSVASELPGALSISSANQLRMCTTCTCD